MLPSAVNTFSAREVLTCPIHIAYSVHCRPCSNTSAGLFIKHMLGAVWRPVHNFTPGAECVKKTTYEINEHLHHFIVDDVLGIVHEEVSVRRVQQLTTCQQHRHNIHPRTRKQATIQTSENTKTLAPIITSQLTIGVCWTAKNSRLLDCMFTFLQILPTGWNLSSFIFIFCFVW